MILTRAQSLRLLRTAKSRPGQPLMEDLLNLRFVRLQGSLGRLRAPSTALYQPCRSTMIAVCCTLLSGRQYRNTPYFEFLQHYLSVDAVTISIISGYLCILVLTMTR
jgi:hypothetical protein